MPVPTPALSYSGLRPGWSPTMEDVVLMPGEQALANVHRVSASRRPDGTLRVTIEGAMRKRDGTSGKHNRHAQVDIDSGDQPAWLNALIVDASKRLSVR